MKLKEYWDQIPAKKKKEFAKACNCTVGHMRNVANGYKRVSTTLAYRIDKATNSVVSKETLRPDFQW